MSTITETPTAQLIASLVASRDEAKRRYRHARETNYQPGLAMYGNELTTLNVLLGRAVDLGLCGAEVWGDDGGY